MGISHFGVIPMDYNIDSIRLDIFHGRGNVYKVIIKYVRTLLSGNWTAITLFTNMLSKWNEWDGYVIITWILGKPMNNLRGAHTLEFADRTDKVCHVFRSLIKDSRVTALWESLKCFHVMCEILSLIFIDDYKDLKELFLASNVDSISSSKNEIAKAVIELYKTKADQFYTHALASFMSQETSGDRETFHLHALRHYMPTFMKRTYERHKMNVGIFTMEGFEYKNYSSKHAIREHSNRRGNVCMQSLKYLTLQFINRKHNVQEEIKKRKQKRKARRKVKAKRKRSFSDVYPSEPACAQIPMRQSESTLT